MEINITNEMLLNVLRETFDDVNPKNVEHIKISKTNQRISIELIQKETSGLNDFSFETGGQMTIDL